MVGWVRREEQVLFAGAFVLAALMRLDAIRTVPVSIDGRYYWQLSESFSFGAPWAHNWREPGTLAYFKIFGAPFGYPLGATQAATFVAAMAAFVVWWRVARRRGPVAGLAMCLVLAVAPLVSVDVAEATREPLGLLLVGLVFLLHDRGQLVWAATVAGATGLVRFELGILLLLCVAVVALPRRQLVPLIVGVMVMVATTGPFMVANGSYYGDVQYASKIHASGARNREMVIRGLPTPEPDLSLPADDIRRHWFFAGELIGWDDYYLEVLGPSESLRRVAVGFVRYSDDLLNQVTPSSSGPVRGVVAVTAAALIGLGAAARDRLARPAAALVVLGILGYSATYIYRLDTRLMEFTLGPIVLLVMLGARQPVATLIDAAQRRVAAPAVPREYETV